MVVGMMLRRVNCLVELVCVLWLFKEKFCIRWGFLCLVLVIGFEFI